MNKNTLSLAESTMYNVASQIDCTKQDSKYETLFALNNDIIEDANDVKSVALANANGVYPNYASLRCKDSHKMLFRLWGKPKSHTVIIELQKSMLNAYKIDLNDEFYSKYAVRDKKYGHIIVDSIEDATDVIMHFMRIVDSEYYSKQESKTTTRKATSKKSKKTA